MYFWNLLYLAPRRRNKLMADLLARKDKLDPRVLENEKYGAIFCDEEFIKVTTSKNIVHLIPWRKIEEVHAFKRDLFTVDLICLALKLTDEDGYFEVHEEMHGYHDMLKVLPDRLPGYTESWYSDVAFPAFGTNLRLIWKSGSPIN